MIACVLAPDWALSLNFLKAASVIPGFIVLCLLAMKPHFQSPELGQSSRRSSNFLEAAISVMPVFVAWNVLCLLATKPHFPVAGAWMELQGIFEFPQSSNFCHSWICRVEFASNKASFPIVGAWSELQEGKTNQRRTLRL
jgi:hypothetical protein